MLEYELQNAVNQALSIVVSFLKNFCRLLAWLIISPILILFAYDVVLYMIMITAPTAKRLTLRHWKRATPAEVMKKPRTRGSRRALVYTGAHIVTSDISHINQRS
ncbi:HBR252Cp [Eremothecium sinecaudum]|uniref:HBR252Cp n=1 Tax=Eremothecium sinecaudum TaxID=45286 RepID=A0A109UX48_9SACH|nr:HBR252Cp [Eremothecium sinecaudum]AMD19153.1 HBR252Cp [Eremothecium sinecaudum]